MNVIETFEGPTVLMELKYCERCGGLWLRPKTASGIYCGSCSIYLSAMPDPGKTTVRKARRRKPKRQTVKAGMLHIEYLQGVATAEVRA